MSRNTHIMAGLIGAGLLVAACGSAAPTADGGDVNESAAPSDSAEPAGSEEFGLTMEELAIRIEQVESAIGECMTEAGFEYIPVDFDTVRAGMTADGTAPGVSSDEFVAEFGFGISTRLGEPDPVIEVSRGQNAAIFDALPEGDQVAYTRTLLGENPEVNFARALEDEDFSETGGCTLDAAEQFFSDDEIVGNYQNPGDAAIDSDPRMVQAFEDWSACLANEGYEYDDPDEVEDDIQDRVDAIVGDSDPAALSGASLDALNELQGYERAVAGLAADCEEEIVDPVTEQIETEIYGAPQG